MTMCSVLAFVRWGDQDGGGCLVKRDQVHFSGWATALWLCVGATIGWCAEAPATPPIAEETPAAAAYARGVAAYDAGQLDEAAHAWRQAIQGDPNFAEAYVGLGVIFLQRGDAVGAEAEFQMALGKNPNHINALANLGALAVQRGQYDIAVSYYRRAVGREPEDASLWVDLAICYTGAGDLPEARSAVLNALAFDPDSHEAQALLKRIERQMAASPSP